MRILLDECVPRGLKRSFPGHLVLTVPAIGYAGKKNGELLPLISSRFDVLVTTDVNLQYQQRLSSYDIAFALLRAKSNDIEDVRPLVPKLLARLGELAPGKLLVID